MTLSRDSESQMDRDYRADSMFTSMARDTMDSIALLLDSPTSRLGAKDRAVLSEARDMLKKRCAHIVAVWD